MKLKKVITLLASLGVPLLVGASSSILSGDLQAKYTAMSQPPLAPPSWLFGVVWPVLYVLMGIACYLVIVSDAKFMTKIMGVSLFAAQLVVNFAWSIVFFRYGLLWGAVGVIVALDLLVIGCIVLFWRMRKSAALLLVPYLGWIAFATYLNIGFAMLN